MDQFPLKTAIGCTESLDTKPVALATGHAGMEQPRNSSALVVCCTMRMHTVVTGQKMWKDARNTVSIEYVDLLKRM